MDDEYRRAVGFSYLHLQDGKALEWIQRNLAERGIAPDIAEVAIIEARRSLAELSAYRNREFAVHMAAGVALLLFGFWLSGNSESAPGRFQGLWITVCILGVAVLGYGIWSRSQKL